MVSRKSLFLYHIEKQVKDKNMTYYSRAIYLLSAWEHLFVFLRKCKFDDCEVAEEVFHSAYRMTLQIILHGDWPKLPKYISSPLEPAIKGCIPIAAKLSYKSMAKKCEFLLTVLADPWTNPTLSRILNNEPVTDDEVIAFFTMEGCQVLIMRLEMLCENKCQDFALRLVEKSLKFSYIFESSDFKSKNDLSHLKDTTFLKDMHLSLLFINKRSHDIIHELKELSLPEGLSMVRRYSKRPSRDELIWKQSDKLCELIAHTVLTSAMLQPVEDDSDRKILFDLIKEWLLMLIKKGSGISELTIMVRKMLEPAESAIHIYTFGQVLKDFDIRYRSLCIELFIRGITLNINEWEQFKMDSDKPNILKIEVALSSGFLQLAEIFKDKLMICREFVLTAFSLNPSPYCLNLIKELAFLSGKCEDRSPSIPTNMKRSKSKKSNSNNPERIGEILNLKPLYKSNKLPDTVNSSLLNIFDSEALDLAPHLCDDLSTILNNPRNLTLSWSSEWSLLKSKCYSYLQEYNRQREVSSNPLQHQELCEIEKNNNSYTADHIFKCEKSKNHGSHCDCIRKIDDKVKSRYISGDYIDLRGKALTPYLKRLNLNPKVVLRKLSVRDLINNKANLGNIRNMDSLPLDNESSCKGINGSNLLLAHSVPGLNSLDMIIPETQESTVQVVQVSNCNSLVKQSSETTDCRGSNSEHVSKSTSVGSQSCPVSFDSQATARDQSTSENFLSLTSLLQNPSQCSSKEKLLSSPSWSQVLPKSSSDPNTSDHLEKASTSERSVLLTSTGTNPAVNVPNMLNEPANENLGNISQFDESKSVNQTADEQKTEHKKKSTSCELDSNDSSDSKVVINRCQSFIVKSSQNMNINISKDDPNSGGTSHSFRLIVAERPDSVMSSEQKTDAGELALITGKLCSQTNYSNPDHYFKLVCKKDPKTQDTSQVASLPKFQHAFGRQVYQLQNDSTEEILGHRNTQPHLEVSQENKKPSTTTSALSKGIQTVSKDIEEAEKGVPSNEKNNIFVSPSTNVVPSTTTSTCQTGLESRPKPTVTEVPSSSGVIFTYKIPGSTKSVVQLKSSSVLKNIDGSLRDIPKIETGPHVVGSKLNESVIRNNINVLLAAALRPVSGSSITSANTVTIQKPLSNDKKSLESNVCQSKVKMNIPSKKAVKRHQTISTSGNIQRVMKPLNQTSIMNSVCQTEPTSIVTIPVPIRTVQVISNDLNTTNLTSGSPNDSERKPNISAHSPVEAAAVSSTTLEQLREFESVLEHITNTSQMKEKGSMKETSLEERSDVTSPKTQTDSSDMDSKSTNTFVGTVVEENSTNASPALSKPNINNNSTSLLSASKISGSTPVVVVQSCTRPVASPALSVSSQSPVSPISTSSSNNVQSKINPKIKSKTKSVGKTASPTSTLKVSNLPKPQQKPQEDEQTTQRIYAILDKYAEQLRNSPELKNKPAPRRRSNPPSNPSHSSKRKKSSQNKSKSGMNLPSSSLDMSPTSEDVQTLGSEDSSNGVSQLSQTLNSPQNNDELSSPSLGDFSSEGTEANKETRPHQIVLTESIPNSGRAVIVQENIQPSVINVDSTKIISGKQVVVGSGNTVPLTLSLPSGGNVKQVIFPVPTDGRPLVVAKVPKMYRVHQVTMPSGSPLIAASPAGTVVLRQMCLNKGNSTLKPVKVPVMSTISSTNITNLTSQPTVVLPSGSQSFPLTASSSFGETFGVTLDNNTIMLNSQAGTMNFVSNKRLAKLSQESNSPTLLCKVNSGDNTDNTSVLEPKSETVIVSSQEVLTCKTSTSVIESKVAKVGPDISPILTRETSSSQKLPPLDTQNRNNKWSQVLSEVKKEEMNSLNKEDKKVLIDSKSPVHMDYNKISDKGFGKPWNDDVKLRKDSYSVICANETVIKSSIYGDSLNTSVNVKSPCEENATESWCSNMKTDFVHKQVLTGDSCQQSSLLFTQDLKKKSMDSPIFHEAFKQNDKNKSSKSDDNLQHRLISNFEKELRLQKSLSEECEDLGVDKPSTSDLFPEAELILEPDPLSRDSIPGEVFSRGLESSSSSHDSPNRSPVFGGKVSSTHFLKQKRTNVRSKKSSKSYLLDHPCNKASASSLSGDSPKNDNCVTVSKNYIVNDGEQLITINCSPAMKQSSVVDAKSNGSESYSDEMFEFSDLEDNCESMTPCSELDSDSNPGKKILKYTDQVGSDISNKFAMSSDAVDSEMELEKSNQGLPSTDLSTSNVSPKSDFQNIMLGKSSPSKYDSGLSWYLMKRQRMTDSPSDSNFNTESEVSFQEAATIDDSDTSNLESHHENGLIVTSEVDTDENVRSGTSDLSGLSFTRKRKAVSPIRGPGNTKLSKGKKIIRSMDSSDDSMSSSDNVTGACDRGHRITRRSSSRGLIKKGCPCLDNSTESHALKKKRDKDKDLERSAKTDKPMFTSNSFSLALVNKKNQNLKMVKTVTKKR